MTKTLTQALSTSSEQALRALAEEKAALLPELPDSSYEEARQALHELRVHQIELEMQNEELRRSQEELETSRARYFDLYDLAPVGYVTLSEPGLILEANLTATRLLGVVRRELIQRPLSRFIHPEDLKTYFRHRKQLFATGDPQVCEVRLLRKDAAPCWVRYDSSAEQNTNGATVCRATFCDITDRRRTEEAQQRALNLLMNITDRVPGVVYQFQLRPDGSSCIPFANDAIRQILQVSPEEVQKDASPVFARLHPDDYHGVVASVQESARDLLPWRHEYRVKFDDGTVHWLFGNATPQRETDGSVLWHGFITDVTERKQADEELRHTKEALEAVNCELQQAVAREQQLAYTDVLTGVHNHRSLMELALQEFDVATRYRQPLTVLLFDIDTFKEVNDTFGHTVGDLILEQVAHVAGAELRAADIIGRYGGDEFVIVLPMTTARQAFPIAERIRTAVAALQAPTPLGDITVTLSIGSAEIRHPPLSDTVVQIVNRADEAMYRAKRAGRNRTVTYSDAPHGAEQIQEELTAAPLDAETLRTLAEDRLRDQPAESVDLMSVAADLELPHELQVYRIELEMQNEELRRTQKELEASRARYFYLYELAPVGFFTLSEQGLVLEANLTAATLLGVARGALLRQPLTRFILTEDQSIYYRHRQQLVATGAPQVCELQMVKRDGMQFRARLEATAAQGVDGTPEYRALLSDITDRKPVAER